MRLHIKSDYKIKPPKIGIIVDGMVHIQHHKLALFSSEMDTFKKKF